MLDNLNWEKWKVLAKCFIEMEINIKDNSEMIFLGEKEECF
jgi:hypothetical protein